MEIKKTSSIAYSCTEISRPQINKKKQYQQTWFHSIYSILFTLESWQTTAHPTYSHSPPPIINMYTSLTHLTSPISTFPNWQGVSIPRISYGHSFQVLVSRMADLPTNTQLITNPKISFSVTYPSLPAFYTH